MEIGHIIYKKHTHKKGIRLHRHFASKNKWITAKFFFITRYKYGFPQALSLIDKESINTVSKFEIKNKLTYPHPKACLFMLLLYRNTHFSIPNYGLAVRVCLNIFQFSLLHSIYRKRKLLQKIFDNFYGWKNLV